MFSCAGYESVSRLVSVSSDTSSPADLALSKDTTHLSYHDYDQLVSELNTIHTNCSDITRLYRSVNNIGIMSREITLEMKQGKRDACQIGIID